MKDQSNNPLDRLEGLLRSWGAKRAVDQTPQPHRPVVMRPVANLWVRWAPLAAAAAMLIVAVGLFSLSLTQARRGQAGGDEFAGLPGPEDERVTAAAEAREVRPPTASKPMEVPEAAPVPAVAPGRRQKLAESPDFASDDLVEDDELGQLRRQREALTTERDELAEENRALMCQLAEADEQLAQLMAELTSVEHSHAEAMSGDVAAMREPQPADSEVGEADTDSYQVGAAGSSPAQAPAALEGAEDEESARKRRDTHYLIVGDGKGAEIPHAEMGEVYLSLAAPDRDGMAAVQAAAANRDLLTRCQIARQGAGDQRTIGLLDQLEVILTRLELLDVGSDKAVSGFMALTRAEGLRESLAEVQATAETKATKMLLLEVQLLLRGADREA